MWAISDEMCSMLEYKVSATHTDPPGGPARAKQAGIVLDTDVADRSDAFGLAEPFVASTAACATKGIKHASPNFYSGTPWSQLSN